MKALLIILFYAWLACRIYRVVYTALYGGTEAEPAAVPETGVVPQELQAFPQELQAFPKERQAVPKERLAVPQEYPAVQQEQHSLQSA